jgi:hypothetical protein
MALVAALASSNFTQFVTASSSAVTLVLFSTPGNTHEPHTLRSSLHGAASLLYNLGTGGGGTLADIAVCEDVSVARAQGVHTLPALRLYRKVESNYASERAMDPTTLPAPLPFAGPLHPPEALASYLRRDAPSLHVVLRADSVKAIRDEVDAVEIAAILFANEDSQAASALLHVAVADRQLRLEISFIVAPPELAVHF